LYGNTGSGQSPVVTISSPNPAIFDASKMVFGHFSSTTIQITTTHPNELILVGVGFNSNYQLNTPTATGLSFTPFTPTAKSGGGSLGAQSYYAIASTAQTYTITIGYSGGVSNNLGIIVAAFSGINPTAPFDGSIVWATGGGVSSIPTVNLSPSLPGDVIWAFQVNANCIAQTPGSGFNLDKATGCYGSPADEYSTSVAPGSQSVTFGKSAQYWVMFAVAIQDPPVTSAATGGSPGTPQVAIPGHDLLVPAEVRAHDLVQLLVVRSEVVD
jgi:hypothetical protein